MLSRICRLSVTVLAATVALPALAAIPPLVSKDGSLSLKASTPEAPLSSSRHQLDTALKYLQYGKLETKNPELELETATVSVEYQQSFPLRAYSGLAIFPKQPIKTARLVGEFFQLSPNKKEGCTGTVVFEELGDTSLKLTLLPKGAIEGLACSLPTAPIENVFVR
jgi:hypothetical protein